MITTDTDANTTIGRVLDEPVMLFDEARPIDRDTEPERWMRALPLQYWGSYFWAELTETPD